MSSFICFMGSWILIMKLYVFGSSMYWVVFFLVSFGLSCSCLVGSYTIHAFSELMVVMFSSHSSFCKLLEVLCNFLLGVKLFFLFLCLVCPLFYIYLFNANTRIISSFFKYLISGSLQVQHFLYGSDPPFASPSPIPTSFVKCLLQSLNSMRKMRHTHLLNSLKVMVSSVSKEKNGLTIGKS